MNSDSCVLNDGRRITYRVAKRSGFPHYYAYFDGPNRRRNEVSTKETSIKRARDSAVALITAAYQPKDAFRDIGWDDAIVMMNDHMMGSNLRPNTITTYKCVLSTFRKLFPDIPGPGSVTPAMAEAYKIRCLKAGHSAHTVKGDLNELSTLFGKWWCKTCKVIDSNPFADVESPKTEKLEPRIISTEERDAFSAWIAERWDNWRLPLLFLEIKAEIGCRIHELAALPTINLKEGRVIFEAGLVKGRRPRKAKLPAHLFEELREIAGPTYAFEQFPTQQRERLMAKGRRHQAQRVKFPYDPRRLVNWLQDRLVEFRREHPEIPRFKLHNLRGTAMSRARERGVGYDEAAIAFGCNPETMRRHYVKLDETAISDSVMDQIQATL